MITNRSVYCANSAGRMALFTAPKTYPHRGLPDEPTIFCFDREIGPGPGQLVSTQLKKISCMDPAPPSGLTPLDPTPKN